MTYWLFYNQLRSRSWRLDRAHQCPLAGELQKSKIRSATAAFDPQRKSFSPPQ
jgi:hypothetical protein